MEQSLRSHDQQKFHSNNEESSGRLKKAIERNRAKRLKKRPPSNDAVEAPQPSLIEEEQNLRPSRPPRRERSFSRGGPARSPRSTRRNQEVEEDLEEEEIEEEIEDEIDDEEDDEEDEGIIAGPPPPRTFPPPPRPQGLEARRSDPRRPPQETRRQREAPKGQGSNIPRQESPPRRALPQPRKTLPSHLSHGGHESQRKKISFIDKRLESFKNWLGPKEKWINYFQKIFWCGCLVLFIHLVFSDRGVSDYYSQRKSLEKKLNGLELLKKNKKELEKNIKLIRKDKFHQKKLVRDHLGFISKDEFLILFQKGKIEI